MHGKRDFGRFFDELLLRRTDSRKDAQEDSDEEGGEQRKDEKQDENRDKLISYSEFIDAIRTGA